MIDAVLVIYHHHLYNSAPTIMEYVNAFSRHLRFPVVAVNTEFGFPSSIRKYCFKSIILHYSLFALWPYRLNKQFFTYLSNQPESYKIAIFQDEYRYCQPRFQFINQYKIDCVYSCIAPEHIPHFYGKYTHAPRVETVLTGYVSEEMIQAAEKYTKPDADRNIDISYRGRPLPFYMGVGAQEKTNIASGFLTRAKDLDFKLDIKTGEEDRIYGTEWYEFLANCRGVLGVESGVSFCDVEDRVRPAVEKLLAQKPDLEFAEVYEKVLKPWEGNIPIRTISPRHFEAAILRVCQILFEGQYAGIMQPMVHYLPLKKDFSNFEEVIRLFRDPQLRHAITENAYRDLILSSRYTYQLLVEKTGRILEENGMSGVVDPALIKKIQSRLVRFERARRPIKMIVHRIRFSRFVQEKLKPFLRPLLMKTRIVNIFS